MANPSILRYPGGKTRAAKLIADMVPETTENIVSPFFGGGSFEFHWARANPEGRVIAADLFYPVANFWQQVKRNPAAVADAVKNYYPLSKDEFYALQQRHLHTTDPVIAAAQFYVLNRASFSGSTLSGGMSPGHARFNEASITRLRDFTMDNVDVDNNSIFTWLRRGPLRRKHVRQDNTVIYLDPPYWINNDNLYGHKGSTHKQFDHKRLYALLNLLTEHGWTWILSYNNSDDVKKLYREYPYIEPQWAYGMSKDKSAKEIIITSGELT